MIGINGRLIGIVTGICITGTTFLLDGRFAAPNIKTVLFPIYFVLINHIFPSMNIPMRFFAEMFGIVPKCRSGKPRFFGYS